VSYRKIVQRALARVDFREFVKISKHDYEFNWHHELICEKLQDFYEGKIKRLMVFTPPRHGKSELVSRRFPAWVLGRNPNAKIIATSYAAEIASSFNRDVQRIIDEKKYHELFPATTLSGSNVRTTQNWLRNNDIFEVVDHKGYYRCAGVGGPITGLGGDYLLIDDPFKNYEEATSHTIRQKVWEWYCSTLWTRQEKNAGIMLVQTRWHEDDLAGRLLEEMKSGGEFAEQWEVVCLPAISEEKRPDDPREEKEALWPNKYDMKWLQSARATLGTTQFNSLYQQNPIPSGGIFIQASWLKEYQDTNYIINFDKIIQSWDMSFGSTGENASYVVGSVYGKHGSRVYLLDQVRGRWSFPETLAQFRLLTSRWPKSSGKLVEKKANGAAVIESLEKEIDGIIAIEPKGSKESRLASVQPIYEAGNIFYPTVGNCPWISDHIGEMVSFPNGKNDDRVDAESQALNYLRGNTHGKWTEELNEVVSSGFENGKIQW
jgi:predicted phage terminase large subunit-like protein